MANLPLGSHEDLLSGLENAEDAGVLRLRDDLAVVQTVDFFTPVVDDPFLFGSIAAANALSDVYAMGGTPVTALNVLCYPIRRMGGAALRRILEGGLAKIHEAGAFLVGGHSVEDDELKYGLAVTGTIHPDRIVRNGGGQPGDRLVLTKPVGTGAVSTAHKRGKASPEAVEGMIVTMSALNDAASRGMLEAGATACTDVTGYGVLGHAAEMAVAGGVGLRIEAASVPALPGALGYLERGSVCGGTRRNREYFGCRVEFTAGIPEGMRHLLFDAQTSGGLLIAVPADRASALVEHLRSDGVGAATVIGEVTEGPAGRIRVV